MEKNKILTENLNWLWASLIIRESYQHGVRHYYLSPGMRNAPFIAALEHFSTLGHSDFFWDIVIDERSAAYRAMGHAKYSGYPAAIICTSGTAMANYMPAVVEAHKNRLPLLVISADRPPELNLSDANQTIEQNLFYSQYVLAQANLGVPTIAISPKALRTTVANLISRSHLSGMGGPGPVHLNCPFRAPLDGSPDQGVSLTDWDAYLQLALKDLDHPSTRYAESYPQVAFEDLENVVKSLERANNPLLVVGELRPWISSDNIAALIKRLHIPFYLDVGSSLKYEYPLSEDHLATAPSFDHPEVMQKYEQNPPDLLLHLGGRLVSRHYYEFLEAYQGIKVFAINDAPTKEDPAHQASYRLVSRPDIFCRDLLSALKDSPTDFTPKAPLLKGSWAKLVQRKEEIIEEVGGDGPLSYPVISKAIIELIPENSSLYLGNSTVIRSFDSYATSKQERRKRCKTYTHRGASGIEGLISAATGLAETKLLKGDHTPTTLVLGDLAALHDLNALLALKNKAIPLVIVLVNNFGGGIFTLLPMTQKEWLLKGMLGSHDIHFSGIAQSFGIAYQQAKTKEEFKSTYQDALTPGQTPLLIEAIFSHEDNHHLYQQLRTIRI